MTGPAPTADRSHGPGDWPAEDAGPARLQRACGPAPQSPLHVTARDAPGACMVVVGPGDAVVAYGSPPAPDSTAWVERLDPDTLGVEARVELPGGPWWPGGIAWHDDGSLHVVHGRHAHRLDPADLSVLAARELPRGRPYNSFVTLPDGRIVTKDLVLDRSEPSALVVLDPQTLEQVGDPLIAPEPSISRLSADGDVVYLVGDATVFRYRWDGRGLARDDGWSFRYRTRVDQSYGWDPVIAAGQVWFLDNGEHRYAGTMVGAGVAAGPVHLVRVAVDDADDAELVEVCGAPQGAATNPPLVAPEHDTVVAYDSANATIATFALGAFPQRRWRRDLATGGHLVHFTDGILLAYDHRGAEGGEAVVLLDLVTGEERGRVATTSAAQSVVFPAATAAGVVYYASFTTLARIAGTPT